MLIKSIRFEPELEDIEKMEETIHLKLNHSDKLGMEFLQDILVHGGIKFQQFLYFYNSIYYVQTEQLNQFQ